LILGTPLFGLGVDFRVLIAIASVFKDGVSKKVAILGPKKRVLLIAPLFDSGLFLVFLT